jgi:hypothetical protein
MQLARCDGQKWFTSAQEDIHMKRIIIVASACGGVLFAGAANAQQPDFSKVEIKTTDLG